MVNIRNFCIVAHIDHGKSTLADSLLRYTNTISESQLRPQYLDKLDVERKRGITIKLQAVRMVYQDVDIGECILNLIDTPGHVDFHYEVSRSLAAAEGVILLVDSTQGIQAQTLSNLYLCLDKNLSIIPVVNKIDMPLAMVDNCKEQIVELLGCNNEDILCISAKRNLGIDILLKSIINNIPVPNINYSSKLRALIFDAVYDQYRGIIAYVRMIDGVLSVKDSIVMMSSGAICEVLDIGYITSDMVSCDKLQSGEVGYIITGIKDIHYYKIGDTITHKKEFNNITAIKGFELPKPVVFSGVYPGSSEDYIALRKALEHLSLNDSSFVYEHETSSFLGHGFRCGFLGMLHMEIINDRLSNEYNLNIINTAPRVKIRVVTNNEDKYILNPNEFPITKILQTYEPIVKVTIVSPELYIGKIITLSQEYRGVMENMNYIGTKLVEVILYLPLMEIIFNFYDQLKSVTSGYATFDYKYHKEEVSQLVRLNILINNELIEALTSIVHVKNARHIGISILKKLKDLLPKHQFEIPLQAAIGNRIIARETIKGVRKDVTGKLYGGDVTRKNKLLDKQKEGKKRMKKFGKVNIPYNVFINIVNTRN